MSAEAFWDSTPREVTNFLEAAQWQHERTARLLRYGAWYTAVFQRIKHFPSLEKAVGGRAARPPRQTLDQQTALLLAWKASCEAKAAARQPRAE